MFQPTFVNRIKNEDCKISNVKKQIYFGIVICLRFICTNLVFTFTNDGLQRFPQCVQYAADWLKKNNNKLYSRVHVFTLVFT